MTLVDHGDGLIITPREPTGPLRKSSDQRGTADQFNGQPAHRVRARDADQRNYVDGWLFVFGRPGEIWTLQLMCMASELSASSWSSLDRLQNRYHRFEPM